MKSTYPKYKVNRWLDPETDNVLYGIDRKPARGEPWAHCCLGSEPMFFGTQERADKEIRDLIAKNAAKAKPEPDPMAAIRSAAPEWAEWLCIIAYGDAYWQTARGSGRVWEVSSRQRVSQWADGSGAFDLWQPFAIHLPSGTVHLQQPDGSIIEVTRKEWDV